ncbi:DNA-(apurinic or apyrimidinic site) lyase [Motilibacter rhizosphaerae]|uniref:Formamidopyrimidine-DNA glycosylase n=1 Tax=Motilibacter rhizosphaerae TaxID=598652 RepID=A0A4Q7NP16_9ACTN|nr:bifunctional DNA-formamidopyrimidine glycosylase/DNA-(apurinic or apyrimidinic site) lyase [Motilibacter rhizosphaerae]RZS87001.1 DNA-(apurinic or apyrimidinic site) lyase [Motilibacter rhizosphaerae]
MPELPEVEVVRRGLEAHVTDRELAAVDVLHARAVRRHVAGAGDLSDRLAGRVLRRPQRRGKYLWVPLDSLEGPGEALVVHLGMSGQLLVQDPAAPDERHLRVRLRFADGGPELRFVDQRTFGGVALVPTGADGVPVIVEHIARDLLDPLEDDAAVARALRAKRTQLKRALLDQTLVSGIGNIYADEALWRAQLHWARPTDRLSRGDALAVLGAAREVMVEALDQGGTSFDALYVNVNGQSGYFDRSLAAYGQEGRPCPRCGTLVVRDPFMGRSSFSCPHCQRPPRGWRREVPARARESVRG